MVALATTIVWNLLNRRHTDDTAKRIRGESFAFDEWKSKRSEVMRTLRELEANFDRLRALSSGGHSMEELLSEIAEEGRSLTIAHQALLRELDRVGDQWADFGYGAENGGERDWDQVHTILDDARQQNDADAARARLLLLEGHAQSISKTIIGELSIATAEHDPNKI